MRDGGVEKKKNKKKKKPSQPEHSEAIMEAPAVSAFSSSPGPHSATESLNYTAALKLLWHLEPWNTSIMWRERTSATPAHRGVSQSEPLLTQPDYYTVGDDRGANITRRRCRHRRLIQTQYKQMSGMKVGMNTGKTKSNLHIQINI